MIRLAKTSSTIDEARKLVAEAAPQHGTVVIADRQTAGRGRRGRGWYTIPDQSLAATVILRNTPDRTQVAMAGMAAAIAVVRAARECLGVDLRTKWPNDVVIGDRKVAGTLAERRANTLLLSIGLNINGTQADLPPELRQTAATLQMIVGTTVDREAVILGVLTELSRTWDILLQRPEELVRSWEALDVTKGAVVRVTEEAGEPIEGLALGVDQSGRLRIRTRGGLIRTASAGDLILLDNECPSQ